MSGEYLQPRTVATDRKYLRAARLNISGKVFNTRIAFEIHKGEQDSTKSGAQSNKSTVSIFNLSEDSRGMIEREAAGYGLQDVRGLFNPMILEAGYQNSFSTIFIGDIVKAEIKRNGPDIETLIEAGDGEYRLMNAHLEISLGADSEVTDSQIIDEVIKSLALGRGSISGLPTTTRNNGFSYSGPAVDLLNQIANKNNLIWSVQNGAVQIRKAGESTNQPTIFLSEKTGLIGIPNKTSNRFKLECLLNPELEPGRLVWVESTALKGVIIEVKGVEHVGDTHGDKWMTTIWGAQI